MPSLIPKGIDIRIAFWTKTSDRAPFVGTEWKLHEVMRRIEIAGDARLCRIDLEDNTGDVLASIRYPSVVD